MKTLKTISLLLLIITALHAIARAQTYKVKIPGADKHWIFNSLDDNKRVAILVKDTLWINKPIEEIKGVKEAVFELRYLMYKGKIYRYSYLFFDPSYFWSGKKKGVELW